MGNLKPNLAFLFQVCMLLFAWRFNYRGADVRDAENGRRHLLGAKPAVWASQGQQDNDEDEDSDDESQLLMGTSAIFPRSYDTVPVAKGKKLKATSSSIERNAWKVDEEDDK
jgi:hypothetical protein